MPTDVSRSSALAVFWIPSVLVAAGGVSRCCRGGRCRGTSRAGIPARTAARASSSPSIASMCPATICGGSTGGRTAGRTGSSSRSSRPIPTCAAAWCSIPAARWVSARRASTKIEYARRIAGALGHLALQQGDAVGLACVAGGHRAQHPAAAQSVAPDGGLRRARADRAAGRDAARPGAARAGRDDLASGR